MNIACSRFRAERAGESANVFIRRERSSRRKKEENGGQNGNPDRCSVERERERERERRGGDDDLLESLCGFRF